MSDSGGTTASRLITPALAIGLVLVSALSLVAYAALSAYAPDFRDASDGQAHVLSNSAIGYAGLKVLLQSEGTPVFIDRGLKKQMPAQPSLKILTPGVMNSSEEIKQACAPAPCLVILPKWLVYPDPIRRGRVMKIEAAPPDAIAKLLTAFSKDSKIAQAGTATTLHLMNPLGWPLPKKLAPVDSLQTLSGKDWFGVINEPDGKFVLAHLKETDLYVLAEPDLVNTHGLQDVAADAFALNVINVLRAGNGPVVFDVTLNGYRKSEDILRVMFAPPFLGATLCALVAALLLGLSAFARFGAPLRSGRAFAFGKSALVDNTAQLIRMMGREPHMGTRYAATMRNLAMRALGFARRMENSQVDASLAALERKNTELNFASLMVEAENVRRRADLMRVAEKLFRWRERILHAR